MIHCHLALRQGFDGGKAGERKLLNLRHSGCREVGKRWKGRSPKSRCNSQSHVAKSSYLKSGPTSKWSIQLWNSSGLNVLMRLAHSLSNNHSSTLLIQSSCPWRSIGKVCKEIEMWILKRYVFTDVLFIRAVMADTSHQLEKSRSLT